MNEFILINKYLKPLSLKNPGALKLNDDIYFDAIKGIAISVDTYVDETPPIAKIFYKILQKRKVPR